MKPIYTFVIYKDKKKEYRWTSFASNGRKTGDSSEGYKRKSQCMRFPVRVQNLCPGNEIEVIDMTKPKN